MRAGAERCKAYLEVLPIPVDLSGHLLQLLQCLVQVLACSLEEIIVYPPRIRTIVLKQSDV